MFKRWILLFSALTLVLTGCAPAMGPKESAGTLLGAGTGALIGSQIGRGSGNLVAVAVGTLAGALIGQSVGQSLDRADYLYMRRNAQQSLEYTPSRRTTTWVNPDSGHRGSFTPLKTYRENDGRYCREYRQQVFIAGRMQQAYGTACRQPDGTWQIIR